MKVRGHVVLGGVGMLFRALNFFYTHAMARTRHFLRKNFPPLFLSNKGINLPDKYETTRSRF